MTYDKSLELIAFGLNRASFNPLELAALNEAMKVLKALVDAQKPKEEAKS